MVLGGTGGGGLLAAGAPEHRRWTTANHTFHLGDLAGDPNFDFINNFAAAADPVDSNTNSDYIDSPYSNSNFSTTYIDTTTYIDKFSQNSNLKFLTLNIQSLPAKFNELNPKCPIELFTPPILLKLTGNTPNGLTYHCVE